MKQPALMWRLFKWALIILPVLACGPLGPRQVTPTPTKTPRRIKTVSQLATATPSVVILQTSVPEAVSPTDTPTLTPIPVTNTPTSAELEPPQEAPAPEPLPPTDTPPPPPPPTNTPPPPPPPTSPPAPPPATNTPVPPPPAANAGPTIIIELPNGDTYSIGDEVKIVITVRDADGVGEVDWGVFTENKTPVLDGEKNCGNATECRIEKEFNADLPGAFQVGAEAKDSKGEKGIQIKQLYVG